MRDIWFISDTHFNHENILNFKTADGSFLRPEFKTMEEMNEYMIQEWSKAVKPNDYIYHMGDIYNGDPRNFRNDIFPRLTGQIRVLLGNHDDGLQIASLPKKIKKLGIIRRFDSDNFICSHIPVHKCSTYNHRKDIYMVNVHGHLHRNMVPDKGYVNICVENTGYKPIHYEDVLKLVEKEIQ